MLKTTNTKTETSHAAAPSRRIVSLLASATEILYGMGLGDQVVAVSHECDWPDDVAKKPRVTRSNVDDRAGSGAIDDQVREMTGAGEALYEIDEAQIVALAPDLIVTQAQCDVCAVRYDDVVAARARHDALSGTQIIALNPTSLDDVLGDIVRVGEAAGAIDVARRWVATLERRIAVVRTRSAQLAPHERVRVAIVEWIDPLMLAGNWMPECVDTAGGTCPLVIGGRHSTYADWRDVVRYDPQVVVVAACGFDLARTIVESDALTKLRGWDRLSAVRAGRVYAVDGNAYFNRSGPRLVDSLEILAHLFHPDRFDIPECIERPEQAWRPLAIRAGK